MKTLSQLINPIPRKSGREIRKQNIDAMFIDTIYGKPLISKVYTMFHNASIRHSQGVEVCHKEAELRTRQLLNMLS